MPSFRPALDVQALPDRTTADERYVTTAWPSAASVGARMTAKHECLGPGETREDDEGDDESEDDRQGEAHAQEACGDPTSRRSKARSIRDASENKTTVSVASARSSTSSRWASGDQPERVDSRRRGPQP